VNPATLIQAGAELLSVVATMAQTHGEAAAETALRAALATLRARRAELDGIEADEDARLAGLL
jgi:hypothetical protein